MSGKEIMNSMQLEFIACMSMHLENFHLEKTSTKDTRQRDRYTQLIACIQSTSFEDAYGMYKKISITDTPTDLFDEATLKAAQRLAKIDMGLPFLFNEAAEI